MKVKIGNKIFDSNEEPVMVIMSPEDLKNISNTTKLHDDGTYKFVSFPSDQDADKVRDWMYDRA
jgi:hypothetical protein